MTAVHQYLRARIWFEVLFHQLGNEDRQKIMHAGMRFQLHQDAFVQERHHLDRPLQVQRDGLHVAPVFQALVAVLIERTVPHREDGRGTEVRVPCRCGVRKHGEVGKC